MKLNTIKIENFLSIKEATIDFEDFSELVRVVGVNTDTKPKSSNGAGKSSIIEAITFALFGKTIRKTTEKSITNSYTKGKCRVTITVNDNVVIERTKKPPMLRVNVDGENYTQESIQVTQKYLENFLNINQSVFLASIVFGQGVATNFLTASADEKRNIIQNFLNVSDIFKQRSRIKSLKSGYYNDKKVANTLLEDSSSSMDKLKQKKKILMSTVKEATVVLRSDKAAFVKKHSIAEIQELEREYRELEVRYTAALQRKSDSEGTVSRATSRIKKNEDAKCEHCDKISLRAWEQNQEDSVLITTHNNIISDSKADIKKLGAELEDKYIPVDVQDFELIEQLKSVESELKSVRSRIREQTKVYNKHVAEVTKAQRGYDLMRFWETAFSEQGLIKYIIRNILSFFNERANYYLGFLTAGAFSIEFSEVLQEDIKNKGTQAYFHSLSGGEKKKVSLAVMLALNDLLLLTGKERSNVVFFDEIADSLDEEGIKGLYELIQHITATKRLFLITHNDYLASLIEDWSDVLEVTKRRHITKIKKL